MQLLVTGSAGLIGATVVKLLKARGDRVVEFDMRQPDPNGSTFDIQDIGHVRNAARECDGIIHLAAVSRVVTAESDPIHCQRVNVEGTRNVCLAASETKRKPFVIFSSSREVYGDPDTLPVSEGHALRPCNVYGRSKLAGERMISDLKESGFNTTILRFSNVYGSTNDHPDRVIPAFARRAASGGSIVVNGADCLFDFTHVEDVAKAVLVATDRMSSGDRIPTLHLASGMGIALGDLAKLAVAASRMPLDVRFEPARCHDVSRFVGDPRLAENVLGWNSCISLEAGFLRLVEEFKTSVSGIAGAART